MSEDKNTTATARLSPGSLWRQIQGNPLKVFLICLGGYSLVRIVEGLYFYVNPSIAADFDVTQKALGVVISVSAAIGILISIVCGTLADVIGRRRMFGVTIIGSGIFVGLQSLAPSLLVMTLLRAVAHGFISAMSPIKTTIVAEAAPARYRGILTGFLQAGSPIGAGVAGAIAIVAIDPYGWRWGFIFALLIIPPGLILWRMLGETGRFQALERSTAASFPRFDVWWRIRELYGSRYRRTAVICTAASIMFGGGVAGSIFFWKPYFEQVKQLAPTMASTVISLGFWVSIAGYFLASVIGEFLLPRRDTFALWMVFGTTALLALIWWADDYMAILVCYSIMSFFILGAIAVFGTLINESFPTHIRLTASTITASSGLDVGIIVFPIVTTQVAEDWLGWDLMFSTFVAIPFLAAAGLFLLLPRVRSGLELEQVAQQMHANNNES